MYALKYLRHYRFFKELTNSQFSVKTNAYFSTKPRSSVVLSKYIRHRKFPHWTSFFVKYSQVMDDLHGKSHFNWIVDDENYHVLRTGCWPFIKFHCTKRPFQDLSAEDQFFSILKVINFGIPCFVYGVGSYFLVKWTETINTGDALVTLYFLYKENSDSPF